MGCKNIKGLVIKTIDYKESDKILTILSFEEGKISVSAKGVRKKNSKLAFSANLFYCGEFEIVETKNFKILTGASLLQDFSKIAMDVDTYVYASHFCEIASFVVMEDQKDEDVVKLLLNLLYSMCKDNKNLRLLRIIYELKMVSLNGLEPELDSCVVCNRINNEYKFSLDEGGLVCCKDGLDIDETCIKIIRYICTEELSEVLKLKLNESQISTIANISNKYIERAFEKQFNIIEKFKKV